MENNNTNIKTGVAAIKQYLSSDGVQAKFKELLGKKAQGFVTSVLQVVANNKQLVNADPASVYGAAAAAAVLDLPINNNLGFAYIVPYNEKQADGSKLQVAQFQIGAKGFKQLALRSGQFAVMNDTDVREGEIKSHNRLTNEIEFAWIDDEEVRLTKKIIAYVSYFKLHNGFDSSWLMYVPAIEKHARKYSKTYAKGYGQWKDDFDSMARKTVTKLNLSKNAPLSIEMQNAIIYDQATINNIDGNDVKYPDATETEAVEINKEEERLLAMINAATSPEDLDLLKEDAEALGQLQAWNQKHLELSKQQ